MAPPPYTKKDKRFSRAPQLPIDPKFKKPTKLKMNVVQYLKLMKQPNNLTIIKREVNDTKAGKNTSESRVTSDSLQGALEIVYGYATNRCRPDTVCLLNVFEKVVTKANVMAILTELDGLVNELFPIANSDAQYRVQVRNVIGKALGHRSAAR
jgi:hypothetical protein